MGIVGCGAFLKALERIPEVEPEVVIAQTFYGFNPHWIGDQAQVLRGPIDADDGEGPLGWSSAAGPHPPPAVAAVRTEVGRSPSPSCAARA